MWLPIALLLPWSCKRRLFIASLRRLFIRCFVRPSGSPSLPPVRITFADNCPLIFG